MGRVSWGRILAGPLPAWLVELQGEKVDLEALTRLLASSSLKVCQEGDIYYLSCPGSIGSADEVRERAREILQRASAAERIRCGSSLPINLGEVIRIEADGTRRPFFSAALRMSWTVRVPHALLTEEDASAFGRWVELAEHDAKVDKALRILITRETNWVNLYNILDVVLSDAGGMIWQAGWTTESEVKRFKHTADSEGTLGDDARHGRERTQPPADPMSLMDAHSLIRSILRAWLAWKSAPGS
jgi:hypothetical protein